MIRVLATCTFTQVYSKEYIDRGVHSFLLYTGVSDNDGWSAHHLRGGYTYYHNSQTGEGQWAEPQGFTGESCELSKDEIQVKLLFPCCTCVCKCVDV